MADEYVDTPGWIARNGYNEAAGWKFYQTVMFPQDATTTDSYMKNGYDGSITGAQAMANANYGIDSNDSDDQDSHYYLNYKFKNIGSDGATYNYSDLIYYRTITMYGGDPVRIGYKIDSSSFTPANGGAVMWQDFPNSNDNHESTKFVHDYHIAAITANPVHIAPTDDLYFNNGDTSETVSSGSILQVVDGTKSLTYSNTSNLFWSTYYDMSNNIKKHGTSYSLPQSYAYDDAVVTGSSWIITDSSGANVNSKFSPVLNKPGQASNYMNLTIDSNVPAVSIYDSPKANGYSTTNNCRLTIYCKGGGGNLDPTRTPDPIPEPVIYPPTAYITAPSGAHQGSSFMVFGFYMFNVLQL